MTKDTLNDQGEARHVGWRPGARLERACLEVVEGLERPASRMLIKDGLPDSAALQPGLLQLSDSIEAERLQPPPRYVYSTRLLLAEGGADSKLGDSLDALLGAAAEKSPWRTHLDWESSDPVPYRFSVEGHKPSREQHREWLNAVRSRLAPHRATDAPSAYVFEIVLSYRGEHPRLFFRSATGGDQRFRYRVREVAAGMSPVLAATLARLVPSPLPGAVIDPTCGGGTLLIERGLLCPDATLIGLDISQPAIEASRANAAASGCARSDFRRADARDPAAWPACGVVLANLPFGIRSGRGDPDLAETYRAILANALQSLAPGGRILLASANLGALEHAVRRNRAQLLARYRALSGGLYVHIFVLGR